MGTAFDTFDQYAFGQFDGQIEDRAHGDVVSRIAEGSDIGFGLGVIDPGPRSAKLPTGSEVSSGITVRETVRDNPAGSNPTTVYDQGEAMSVIRVGRVWVTTTDGASVGDDVYVVPSTGAITNTDNSGTNIQLPNAAFKSSASGGGRALVQLNGAE